MCCNRLHRLALLLTGTSVVGCSAGELSLPNDGTPVRMVVVSGDGQEATAGSRLPNPLVVRLTDADSRPVGGAALVFSFQGEVPDAEVDPASVETDSTGLASVRVRLGTTLGTQIVEARLDAQSSDLRATFGMTALERRGGGNEGGGGGGGGSHDEKKGEHKGRGHDHGD